MPISSEEPPGASVEAHAGAVGLGHEAVVAGGGERVLDRVLGGGLDVCRGLDVELEADQCRRGRPRTAAESASASLSASAGGPRSSWRRQTICWRWSASASTGLASVSSRRHLRRRRRGRRSGRRPPCGTSARRGCGPRAPATTTLTLASSKASFEPGNSSAWRSAAFSRRDARDRERVGHRLGHGAGEHADADDRHDPGGEEDRPPPVGGLAEPVEQGCHGSCLFCVGSLWVGRGAGGAGYSKADRSESIASLKTSARSRSGCSR